MGGDFLITAQTALEELRHGVRRLNAYSKPGSVIIMMPAALATGWFLPRLSQLRRHHPSIDPWVHTSDQHHIPEEAEIDIVLGPLPWADPGARSVLLADERLLPLCSPDLAASLPDLPDRARLDAAPLLHDESLNDWQSWFSQVGSARTEFIRGFNFSDTGQMLQAAILGHGVCLATALQGDQPIKDGRLVPACAAPLKRTEPLYMSCWRRNFSRSSVTSLWQWMEEQFGPASPRHSGGG